MIYAFYGGLHNQETAESNHRLETQDAAFVSPEWREAYGFRRVHTCRNCCNMEFSVFFTCKRFKTLPGIEGNLYALDDMVCDFWGIPEGPRDPALQNEWARKVYERDGYTCQSCGLKGCEASTNYIEQGGRTLTVFDPGIALHAHHIKPFALFPKLAWDIDNGITLCEKCHHQAHSHAYAIEGRPQT
jgi:hypothetical protein